MKLGCSTILYGSHDLKLAIEKIASFGYKAVELCALGQAPHLTIGAEASYYKDVKAMIEDNGLAIESIGASGSLRQGRDHVLRVLDAAAAVGAPAIASGPGGESDNEESFKEVVENINDLATEGAKRGVKLSFKPHVKNAVYSTESAYRFMQEVDRDWVGLNYDPTHIWRTPEQEVPEETIGKILDYIFTARIRDVKGREQAIGPVENQVAGNGDLNLQGLADQFQKVPGLEYAVVEIVGTKNMSVEEIDSVVERSFSGLNPLFN